MVICWYVYYIINKIHSGQKHIHINKICTEEPSRYTHTDACCIYISPPDSPEVSPPTYSFKWENRNHFSVSSGTVLLGQPICALLACSAGCSQWHQGIGLLWVIVEWKEEKRLLPAHSYSRYKPLKTINLDMPYISFLVQGWCVDIKAGTAYSIPLELWGQKQDKDG